MNIFEELFEVSKQLEVAAAVSTSQEVAAPLELLESKAATLGRSASGSWLGYHSRVYYNNFNSIPAGANFSQEWGLQDLSFSDLGTRGDWREYQFDTAIRHIFAQAGNPDLAPAYSAKTACDNFFDESKSTIISLLEIELQRLSDAFISKMKSDIEHLRPFSKGDVIDELSPKGKIMTRDTLAAGQGNLAPPHIDVLADVRSIRHSFGICRAAANIAKKAASHLERKVQRKTANERLGTNVFIGHGRSHLWSALKDFMQDRLSLRWDEFNRVPVAGVTNIARLSEMLDSAAIAFLVMTAEDEMADGATQARMNVVHEAGLFQGRLGFTKAIVLLEEGCSEFSNIQGLGQIRFPRGNIRASFEEIRLVLEREGIIE